jgi:hypothetical protein
MGVPVTPGRPEPGFEVLRDPATHRLGVGTTHALSSVVTGIFPPSLASLDYYPGGKVKGGTRAGWPHSPTRCSPALRQPVGLGIPLTDPIGPGGPGPR